MNFFEYLFCRLYWWNTKIIKETDIPVFYCVCGLSVFQTYSIMPIYILLYILRVFNGDIDILNMSPYLLVNAIILIADYLYFKKKKYTVLLKKFGEIRKNTKIKLDILCIIYILMIIISNVVVFIVYRAQHGIS
jgi:hypothetical protein